MDDEYDLWPAEDLLIYRSGDSLKKFFPIYWSKIQKHYESSAPRKCMPKLSPLDLHHKWELGSYKDRELRAAIANISPSVVSVSYFSGVQRKVDCSGVIIHWDDYNGQATILTSAKLMRSPQKRDNYYIVVRLANGKILLAEEHYVDYYHNIMTVKVNSDVELKPVKLDSPPLNTLKGDVVALRREFHNCKLSESSGLIREDYPYFGCEFLVSSTCRSGQGGEGGPLINKTGHVCGINFYDGYHCVHPLPTSVIRSCLDKWSKYGIVLQPWFGLTVIDIAELPHDAFETPEFCGDSSAVVKEVYKGSPADKVGVRPGDSVTCLHEYSVFCASQYAQALDSVSDKLSAYHPDKTFNIMLCVEGNDCRKVVHAENLRVDDKRFCCSWLGEESDWSFMHPLIGSQTDPAYDIGVNTDVSLEPLGSVSYDTGIDDDVPM